MTTKHNLITPSELASILSRGDTITVIDVRSPDDYQLCHLPEAKCNCVFESAFLEQISSIASDVTKQVCVYGNSVYTLEARMAAEKLVRAGYPNVLELREGLDGWKQSGFPVQESSKPTSPPTPLPDGKRQVDLAESRVKWIGRNLLNSHCGSLALQSGFLEFAHNTLTAGEFTFDMNDIACDDLEDDSSHDSLIGHLKSYDFFDTELFPQAHFRLLNVTPITGSSPGSPNLQLAGELTLKDKTHILTFDAVSGLTDKGRFAAQATISFDRTRWNVLYGSGKFFSNLGMHLVNDLIELHVRVVTK